MEFGKPLRYSLKGARRLRVGDYRVIYTIEPDEVVLIVTIGDRRDVYESRR
jgi:mRNA-degrading endonuclease RelE of RelBE toxin-antitoxin system